MPTHTITNYNNPEHYTAVSNGVFGPKYIAKNGPVQHVVKREAEAEADPALLYTTSNVVSGVVPYTYNNVAAPVVKPFTTTYNVVPSVHNVVPAVHSVAAMPTYVRKVAAPLTTYTNTVAAPLTTNNVVSPVVYTNNVVTGLASNGAHAVAATPMGLTHSSNVGVCTNVHGVQVPC